jgi:selenide,water dikinase
MKRMNREACTVFLAHGVRSCTDVTGFSLAGHGLELAEKSGVRLRLFARSLEFLPGARELAAQGSVPGGTGRNRAYFQDRLDFGSSLDEVFRTLVFSPETSGGLLAAVPAAQVSACMLDLARAGVAGRIVGMVESGGDGTEGARIRVEDTAPGSV